VITFDRVTAVVDAPAGPRTLLADVTASLAERRVVVIGANGSGKSTLLRLVNGLVRPTSGRVEVDGCATTGQTAAQVRRRVGFIFTDPLSQLLMPTPVEDIALSLRRVGPTARRQERARQLLAEWGLDHLAHVSVYDLSGGERQLVALVSVLAATPAVIVADEPSTLLDLANSRRLQAALAGLDQQELVATHDLAWAETFERALVVEAGRLAFDGPAPEAVAWYCRRAGV